MNEHQNDARHLARGDPRRGRSDLGQMTGMNRLVFAEARLEPDAEAAVSSGAEAFVYVISGRGILTTQSEQIEVAAGDFVGITAAEDAHISNPFSAILVYLSGGEKS